MYTIVGATGNTGRVVAERLLDEGHEVRAIGRSEERLRPLAERGAEPVVGAIEDPEFAVRAFDEATAAYSMIPPNYAAPEVRAWQSQVSRSIAEGLRASGVTHVVNLSSVGAQLAEGTGPIAGLHEHEQRLNAIGDLHVLHLRPAWFMENFYAALDGIRAMDALVMPIRRDVPVAMIATRDIGEEAARRLLELDFEGKGFQELLGAREVTLEEAAEVIGSALGRPGLPYVEASREQAREALAEQGFPEAAIRSLLEMYDAFNTGRIAPEEPRAAASTTRTDLREFATNQMLNVWEAGGAAR
jgi:uncharacterized protein YbjT (DUF2867 family)